MTTPLEHLSFFTDQTNITKEDLMEKKNISVGDFVCFFADYSNEKIFGHVYKITEEGTVYLVKTRLGSTQKRKEELFVLTEKDTEEILSDKGIISFMHATGEVMKGKIASQVDRETNSIRVQVKQKLYRIGLEQIIYPEQETREWKSPKIEPDVSKQQQYTKFKIQPIEFIEANNLSYSQGNVIKYVCRYQDKDGLKDLQKARVYIDYLIQKLEKGEVKA